MGNDSLAAVIDRLLEARKTLAGRPAWENSPRPDEEKRLLWPLRINNEPCGADLLATAFPSYGNSKEMWRIMIMAPRCIWRIDYAYDGNHINSLDRPSDLREHNFNEPHYHAWADNKRFCSHSALPETLKNARIMPANIRNFHNAFRWLCDLTNIEQPSNDGMIELPPRDRLI
ncbi:MAG: hypothetical protein K2Q01_12475 [Rickettsiales bacterium]|nr:hypothetical protein [Rickettsiales bacterium]